MKSSFIYALLSLFFKFNSFILSQLFLLLALLFNTCLKIPHLLKFSDF